MTDGEGGMIEGTESRLEGTTLLVRTPMRFQRRGGRKRIVTPDGSETAPTTKPQPDGALVKALARAWRCQRMFDEGQYSSVTEIGEAEGINRSYVSRVLRLILLAPDIVKRIFDGRGPTRLSGLLRYAPPYDETNVALPTARSVASSR